MNTQTTASANRAQVNAPSQALPSLSNLRVKKALLITSGQGEQHVALLGKQGRAEIRRRVNGADQPYLYVSYHQGQHELNESSEMKVIHFPALDDVLIEWAEMQQIDGVPTVVLTLADDYRVLFSAGVDDESITVEFADPSEAVE